MQNLYGNPSCESVTLVEILEIISPFEEFEATVGLALSRLEAEGVQALVRIQFYCQPGSREAGAVITFANRDHFMAHIRMITEWLEFKDFFRTVRPVDIRIYGRLSEEAAQWIGAFDVVSRNFEQYVAGFVR
jgi:hypothetical protein